jgi:hypothetical protein
MDAENLTPNEMRSPVRPTRSESLYRLSYPGPEVKSAYKNTAEVNFVLRNSVDIRATKGVSSNNKNNTKTNLQNNNHNIIYSGYKPIT